MGVAPPLTFTKIGKTVPLAYGTPLASFTVPVTVVLPAIAGMIETSAKTANIKSRFIEISHAET